MPPAYASPDPQATPRRTPPPVPLVLAPRLAGLAGNPRRPPGTTRLRRSRRSGGGGRCARPPDGACGKERDVAGKRLEPGDPAPGCTLTDADGKQVSLSGLRGQRVIV